MESKLNQTVVRKSTRKWLRSWPGTDWKVTRTLTRELTRRWLKKWPTWCEEAAQKPTTKVTRKWLKGCAPRQWEATALNPGSACAPRCNVHMILVWKTMTAVHFVVDSACFAVVSNAFNLKPEHTGNGNNKTMELGDHYMPTQLESPI